MLHLMKFIRECTVWLHQPLFESGMFYLDLWSLVHFWSGIMVFTGLTVLKWKHKWRWLAFFLFAFELVEATVFISILKMFRPEKLPDCFTDIFVGMAGGALVWYLFEKRKWAGNFALFFVFWLAAGTVSFLWTGNFGYIFRDATENSAGFNWWIFLFWLVAGIGILFIYDSKIKWNKKQLQSVLSTWLVYILPVLLVYSLGSGLLFGGENMPDGQVLKENLVAAKNTKTIFYLCSPFLFILTYHYINKLFTQYFKSIIP